MATSLDHTRCTRTRSKACTQVPSFRHETGHAGIFNVTCGVCRKAIKPDAIRLTHAACNRASHVRCLEQFCRARGQGECPNCVRDVEVFTAAPLRRESVAKQDPDRAQLDTNNTNPGPRACSMLHKRTESCDAATQHGSVRSGWAKIRHVVRRMWSDPNHCAELIGLAPFLYFAVFGLPAWCAHVLQEALDFGFSIVRRVGLLDVVLIFIIGYLLGCLVTRLHFQAHQIAVAIDAWWARKTQWLGQKLLLALSILLTGWILSLVLGIR